MTGGIPSELGNLANLEALSLGNNRLTGGIPSELGDLSRLTLLQLSTNQLTGAIPPELGRLVRLTRLWIGGNAGLSGPLPGTLTNLAVLEYLSLGETALCAPTDSAFQRWLDGVSNKSGVINCAGPPAGVGDGSRFAVGRHPLLRTEVVLIRRGESEREPFVRRR